MKAFDFLLAAACTGIAIEQATHGRWMLAAVALAIAVLLVADPTKERP